MDTSYINKTIKNLLSIMGVDAEIENIFLKNEDRDVLKINILTQKEAGLLIGPQGENLNALQTILKVMLRKQNLEGLNPLIVLDVNNYKKERQEFLKKLAADAIKKAFLNGKTELSPMNAFDRRIIHLTVASVGGDISSESIDEGENRRVVIYHKTSEKNT